VGQENFDWVVEAASKMAVERARAQKDGQDNLTWGTFVTKAAFAEAGRAKPAKKPAVKKSASKK
jgi:hypothetical protein